jgi:hypothetical protein
LRKLFEPFGQIRECKVMVDKNTGISRQIGFVRYVIMVSTSFSASLITLRNRFESMEDARAALEQMNGYGLADPDTGANHTLVGSYFASMGNLRQRAYPSQ